MQNANAKVNNANSLASKSKSNVNTLSQKSSNQLQKSHAGPHCADENENSNISETAKNQASTNGSESDFIGVEKHRTKRLYLGGVHEGVNEQLIVNYMEKKGISPTIVRLFKSKRKGTVAVRVNVKLSGFQTVSVNDFSPKHVYAREWISKQKWLKKIRLMMTKLESVVLMSDHRFYNHDNLGFIVGLTERFCYTSYYILCMLVHIAFNNVRHS